MESNKEIVPKVLKGAFIERDATVVDRYFSPDYVQHNPVIPNGPAAIAGLIPTLKNLSCEIGMVVAEGDLVMVHGRYVGWGPKPLVAVDIFKVKDRKVVEALGCHAGRSSRHRDGERQSHVLACVTLGAGSGRERFVIGGPLSGLQLRPL